MRPVFNFNSQRARKARFGLHFGHKPFVVLLQFLTVASLVGGLVILVSTDTSYGWLLMIPGVVVLPILLWFFGELKDLPSKNDGTIDGMLDANVLGRLGTNPNPSPQAIAKALDRSVGANFYAARFGVPLHLVSEYTSQNSADSEAIWERALQIANQTQQKSVSSSALFAATLFSMPGYDQVLAQLHLDEKDILAGVDWQIHLKNVAEYHKERPLYGGIARDWAFGYTPLLERFGYNITEHIQGSGLIARDIKPHQAVLSQSMQVLTQSARRNATLIGGVGAGKTTLVKILAEKLINPSSDVPKELRYSQVITLDPASLISRASGRGELENLVQQLFVEALRAKNIILFLDDAQLFLEDGTGSINLSNILLPVLEGGALRVILSMDEQRWLELSQANPSLAQLLNRVPVKPLDRENTLRILEDQLIMLEYQSKTVVMYQALREAYNLGVRYVQDQVMPGQAIKLLESATRYAQQNFVTAGSVQQAIEQSYGIKVTTANQADERQTLLNLEELIHKRMINQTRAVQVVSDALRRARAGVRSQNRPIGTFLFLGPTGVGKTELAKSLAAAYFGGEDRIVRVDLNEYVRSEDLIRLIAEPARDPNSLTAKISKQPFSVVLLDEIEKAHPDILSSLLQLLDEGILRDATNREVSFRDSIIIATSNAGAGQIREHIEKGEAVEQFERQFTDELINSNQFRPEFLNRFDEIVIFRPLTMDELMQVVDLIIASINKTIGTQNISIVLTDQAKQYLVQQGYDPRLGARPLRRVVQRTVESVLAQRLLSGEISAGQQITLDIGDITNSGSNTDET